MCTKPRRNYNQAFAPEPPRKRRKSTKALATATEQKAAGPTAAKEVTPAAAGAQAFRENNPGYTAIELGVLVDNIRTKANATF